MPAGFRVVEAEIKSFESAQECRGSRARGELWRNRYCLCEWEKFAQEKRGKEMGPVHRGL